MRIRIIGGLRASRSMGPLVMLGTLGIVLSCGAVSAKAEGFYEFEVGTESRMRGTVRLEEQGTVSVKADRLRQELRGTRTVVTRRGARYQKPTHRVTLDQLDTGRRYRVNVDAGTYVEESFASLRQQQEKEIVAMEKALQINPTDVPPSLVVSVVRTGESQQAHGRTCERVLLKATKEVTRGATPTPSQYAMTFDLCMVWETPLIQEVRVLEARVGHLTGVRGALLERQLRIFEHRPDTRAIFQLMYRLVEREQEKLGGVPMRWEQRFVGPKRGQPEVTLFRHWGEVTRIDDRVLDGSDFELPSGLKAEQGNIIR